MATYDLTSSIPSADDLRDGDIINCPYSGSYKMIKLPKGVYKLEVWGAEGGYRSSNRYSGKGGYSYGTLTLKNKNKTKMYLYAGGSGNSISSATSSVYPGGFNGGGYRYGHRGGGGASDIRIGTDSLYARVIVAGGGGSDGSTSAAGGAGGGTSGITGTGSCGTTYGPGTQTYSGSSTSQTATTQATTNSSSSSYAYGGFGFGGFGIYYDSGYGGAGGGGWYGGGGTMPDVSADDDRGGSGGSGYVYTSSTASNYPSGCLLDSNYYLTNASTVAGNTSFIDPESGSSTTGRYGNGYVRITCVEIYSGAYEKTESGWVKLYQDGLNILASNSDALIKKFIFKMSEWSSVSTLPYQFYCGSAILLNNEIHILGSNNNSYKTSHYKYNPITATWSNVSILPYEFSYGSAIVLDNEIHILGSYSSSYKTSHYKYNTSTNTWSSVSTLPYKFAFGSIVVLNNEIHIMGSGNYSNGSYPYSKYHYKYNTSTNTWTSVSTLPYEFYYGSAIVLNNEIHILGSGSSGSKYHYKYNTSTNTWTSVSTLPYKFAYGSIVVLDNEIHILGGSGNNSSYKTSHYKISSGKWIPEY